MMKILNAIICGPIYFYKCVISPLLPKSCRYHPTCSDYALGAFKKHGPIKGAWLAVRRILSCHPYSKRPFHDPVPERIAPSETMRYKRSTVKKKQ